ncbi:MAG: AraC family transcriptional regulator ligand-binding domain-containing protein [Marinobacter sp.]|uniref:AraC family transcriptional regulator n=1 Tax=Marinobacter sp. TaxID=50741 RepID=UPI00299F2F60|nr:AraC family transcriptional regulator ligand-binding domain-containing protein [Marinobacter sp.]MDX1755440.1 AraC family transcriptional regulator ligand-binding domain-containing protein [Marinobacter sp.]
MTHESRLTEASIPASYSRLVAQELGLHTPHLPKLLVSTSLSVDDLLSEDTRLTPRQQIQILANALRLNTAVDFGLRLGRRLTPAAHGPVGYLVSTSQNLLEALQAVHAFVPTRMSFVRLALEEQGEHLLLRFFFDVEMPADVSRCLAEICVMTFFATAQFIIGRPASEAETYFAHPDPGGGASYREHLPGPVSFSSPETYVRLPIGLCQIPNASANHESYVLARAQCEAILANLQTHPDSYRRRIETMLLTQPTVSLTEDSAASALFISKRTLARHLKAEGTSFRQIRDEIRSWQAQRHLRDGQLSVEAIASLLGYHDSANFRRAFKRWHGMSPSEFRQHDCALSRGAPTLPEPAVTQTG